MIKDINYSGYSTSPSDYECADGSLAAAMNVIPEDGHLKTVFRPNTKHIFGENETPLFIHKTSRYKHYIVWRAKKSSASNVPASGEQTEPTEPTEPTTGYEQSGEIEDDPEQAGEGDYVISGEPEDDPEQAGEGDYVISGEPEDDPEQAEDYDGPSPEEEQPSDLPEPEIYGLVWYDEDFAFGGEVDKTLTSVKQIQAIGNTLIVLTPGHINYYLWKATAYCSLGDHLPEIAISFGLVGHPYLYSKTYAINGTFTNGTIDITFDESVKYYMPHVSEVNAAQEALAKFSDKNAESVTSQVMAKVNKFISEQTTNKGRFCFPFFIRWAYRLYDGSLVMHSPPVLMTPSTTATPIVMFTKITKGLALTSKYEFTGATADIFMVTADTNYCLLKYGAYDKLGDWEDIISSVDFFVSKPIYNYDQSGKITGLSDLDNFESKFVGKINYKGLDSIATDGDYESHSVKNNNLTFFSNPPEYLEYKYNQIYSLFFTEGLSYPTYTLKMPEFSEGKINDSIESTSNFFKLASVNLRKLTPGKRTKIDVNDEYLQTLVNREVMTDDFQTHDSIAAAGSYIFNSRLNVSCVERGLFSGFPANAMFPYCEDIFHLYKEDGTRYVYHHNDKGRITIDVYTRNNGMVSKVRTDTNGLPDLRKFVDDFNYTMYFNKEDGDGGTISTTVKYDFSAGTKTTYDGDGNVISVEQNRYIPTSWGSWLYYPDPNAFKIAISHGDSVKFVCDLKPHDFLHGAYAFLGFDSERGNSSTIEAQPEVTDTTNTVLEPNKIYTSEINNPFYFPAIGVNTVGDGDIINLSSAAKALSQGQFGQFPLYAFTTEGVWALEVSATGTYTAKQPITRDVCINPDSITQLDSAVLFATDRGIMLLTGSEASCISDTINAEQPFNVMSLPAMDKLSKLIYPAAKDCLPTAPFLKFLAGSAMVYDYTHQRVIVFNPEYSYAYVYSMRSKEWGMTTSNLLSTLNSYPDALAFTKEHKLVSFSENSQVPVRGLFVTRPMKLDAPDVLKTVDTVIQRGQFAKGDVNTVLYGSRDLYNWFVVWSSVDHTLRGFRGTPYKYFRIASVTRLTEDKSVSGAAVQFTPRHTNVLR